MEGAFKIELIRRLVRCKSLCIAILFVSLAGGSQVTHLSIPFFRNYQFPQLYQLDSLASTNSPSRYFGNLYFSFLTAIERQLVPADSATKQMVRRFERVFAQFYIDACFAHERGQQPPLQEWRCYFSNRGLQPIQYKLLGANAHLNGGLWQALTQSFSQTEMTGLKAEFRIFKSSLNQTYRLVYDEGVSQNKRIRNLDRFTFGISKWVGNFYLYKWRKRQMRLARYCWSHSPRYGPLLEKIRLKKKKIDRLILGQL
jgi:Family of unknown function (DUF5995)